MLGKPQGAGYCNLTAKDPETHRAHMIGELDYISRSAWSDLCDLRSCHPLAWQKPEYPLKQLWVQVLG